MARKFPNMPKQPSSADMVKQAQKMKQDMIALQLEMEEREFEAAAGGGVVKAVVTGKKELRSIEISPEAVDPDDIEMLQDMIVAAVNEAIRRADSTMDDEMAKITGGLNISLF